MKPKNIYDLREELIDAEKLCDVLHLYPDHAVIVFSPLIENLSHKKNQLKKYIEDNFNEIHHVDIFSNYVVVWHNHLKLDINHVKVNYP